MRWLCNRHRIEAELEARIKQGKVRKCEVPGCDEYVRARGVCARHYNREWKRNKLRSKYPWLKALETLEKVLIEAEATGRVAVDVHVYFYPNGDDDNVIT
jgi:hypothetical protein